MRMLNSKYRSQSSANVFFCEKCGTNEFRKLQWKRKKINRFSRDSEAEAFAEKHKNCDGIFCDNCQTNWENVEKFNSHASKLGI